MKKYIWYGGDKMELREVFDEDKQPRWWVEAQSMIDGNRSINEPACCIHEGNLHGYYERARKKMKKVL